MRRFLLIAMSAVALTLGLAVTAGATGSPPPNTNEVAYWCGGSDMGVKYDNLNSTSFTVPAPPDGKTWTLLVLKAGSDQSVEHENETFTNPEVGESYSHSSGKTLSHAILCYGYATTTTTAPTTTGATTTLATTTTAATTTIATTTTGATTTAATTTVPQTTTTVPCDVLHNCTSIPETTATTAATTTVVATTVPASTTTVAPPTTAAPVVTPAAPVATPTELPHTGSDTVPLTAAGLGLIGVGAFLVRRMRAA